MIEDKIISADCWIIRLEDAWAYTLQISFEENPAVEKALIDVFEGWDRAATGLDP